MRLQRRWTWLIALGFGLCPAAIARAEDLTRAPAVLLSFQGCEQGEVDEIRRLVPIDLGGATEADRLQHGDVSILCRDRIVELRLRQPPAHELFRSLDFSATEASARPRLVAIVVIELLAAGGSDGEAKRAPQRPESSSASSEAHPMGMATRPDSRLQVEAIGSGRTLIGGVPRLLGGGVKIAANRGIPWSGDVLFERSSPTTTAGSVRIDSLTTGVALSLVAPLGAATARAGVGVRGGFAHFVGRPNDPTQVRSDSLLRGWGGPMLDGGITLPLRRSVVFEFVMESGYVLFPIYGLVTGQREIALRGVWIGAQIGVGIAL